jgi:hypothetical protein
VTGCDKGSSTLRGARALSTRPTVSANTILLHVTANCVLPIHLHEPPSRNSNHFDCLRDDDDDDECDAIATPDDSASDTLHAQPKASRSNAAPAGEGVLIPPHAGHASHTTYACALSQSLE